MGRLVDLFKIRPFPNFSFRLFHSSPPRKYIYEQEEEEEEESWRGNAHAIYVYIRDIGVICSADISNTRIPRRRTRAERHFYEEPAGYAYKYRQYILLAVDRQSFSCVKYFNRQITIPPSPVLFYSSPSQFPPIVV